MIITVEADRPALQRVWVSGCGVVSPLGTGVDAFWRRLLGGASALAPITCFDTGGQSVSVGAQVPDLDASPWLTAAEKGRLERIDQYALVAAREALWDAQLEINRLDTTRVAVIVGSSLGGMEAGEDYLRAQGSGTPFATDRLLDHPYYATATNLARALGVRGPVLSPSIACASGTHAVGMAFDLIRLGHADVSIVGGAETLCEFIVTGFNCLRATTNETLRPFDARRSGLLLGEGAAMLVIESDDHARRRQRTSTIEVCGSGISSDAVHMTAPARDGSGAARAMRMALADAAMTPDEIDFVSTHGTGTVYNDAMEINALHTVFGARATQIPMNAIKGSIGHTLAAAGAFEAVMCREVLRHGIIPPSVNCGTLDPACDLDIVRGSSRIHPVERLLSTSSAFAGNNAAIVMRKVIV